MNQKENTLRKTLLLTCVSSALLVGACGGDDGGGETTQAEGDQAQELSGTIRVDGSSTVAPLSEAAAELFNEEHPNVRISVGTSGTGGGFEKFCRGETDISDASRPIGEDEIAACEERGISQEELTVANDALSIVVNPENDWAECLTVEQLNQMWDRGSDVDNWSDIDPEFPDEPLELYGPGTDSGTFDYFTEAINGEEGVQRTDYNNIGEDDNAVITGVGGTTGALGYVPLSFVKNNADAIKPVPIENPETGECVEPSDETVQDGTYQPLGRPLFVYAKDEAISRPEVRAFLNFYIENSDTITEQAQFIALTDEQKQEAQQAIEQLAEGAGSSSSEPTPEETP
jgi:phosphate transport system substrate-binding protein